MYFFDLIVDKVKEYRTNSTIVRGNYSFFVVYCRECQSAGEFGYYREKTRRNPSGWNCVAKVALSCNEVTKTLEKQVEHMTENCAERVIVFPCGCRMKTTVSKDEPCAHPDCVACEECGKLHKPGEWREESLCEAHQQFFTDWPEMKGISCDYLLPPVDGIGSYTASKIIRQMLDGEIPNDRKKMVVLCDILRRDSFDCYFLSVTKRALDKDLRSIVARGVRRKWEAERILTKHGGVLDKSALCHLHRVILRAKGLLFLVRGVVMLCVVMALWWKVPDMKTVIVLLVLAGAWFVWKRANTWFN